MRKIIKMFSVFSGFTQTQKTNLLCPRKFFTGMLKQVSPSATWATPMPSNICYTIPLLVTVGSSYTMSQPEQQMNKCYSITTMRNTCSSKIILPVALRVYRQVRNEKYRSVLRTIPCRLRARLPQSEEKVLLQSHCIAMLASLSSMVAMKRMSWQNILRLWPSQVETVTMKSSTPVLDGYRYSGNYTA